MRCHPILSCCWTAVRKSGGKWLGRMTLPLCHRFSPFTRVLRMSGDVWRFLSRVRRRRKARVHLRVAPCPRHCVMCLVSSQGCEHRGHVASD